MILIQRNQFVKFKILISNSIPVISEVPQEDHLSPLLFNLFINDIDFSINNYNIVFLANGPEIYKLIKSSEEAKLLQSDLNN